MTIVSRVRHNYFTGGSHSFLSGPIRRLFLGKRLSSAGIGAGTGGQSVSVVGGGGSEETHLHSPRGSSGVSGDSVINPSASREII